jgi:hypothetical protein
MAHLLRNWVALRLRSWRVRRVRGDRQGHGTLVDDARPGGGTLEEAERTSLDQNTAWPKEIAATTIMIAIMIAPMKSSFAIPAEAADTPEYPKKPATMEIRKKISAHLSICSLSTKTAITTHGSATGSKRLGDFWRPYRWPACLCSRSSLARAEASRRGPATLGAVRNSTPLRRPVAAPKLITSERLPTSPIHRNALTTLL